MLTVDIFARIRQLRKDGQTIRQIAEQLHCSPKTILKAFAQPEPKPYTRSDPRTAPVFGPFRSVVDAILEADRTAPRKQRHTAMQIHRRLVAEYDYRGGYDQVRRYLQERRRSQRETFIPLDHRPGVRAEADFGHIHVDFPDGRRAVPVLIVTWSYSNAPFAIALPTERTEAILHGLVESFQFFDGVPNELWWDNPSTVAVHIWSGRERMLHPRYLALSSHYLFTPKFCMPAAATEKPRVENRVYDLERQWATPVPQVKDLVELNAHLLRCCLRARERCCGDNTATVQARFAEDRALALPVPEMSFDACVIQSGQVDKYQTVRFDSNSYSVPRRFAFRPVMIKGYIDQVAIVADGRVIATHRRSYGHREKVLDPRHFLGVLERKPAALDHAPVYRDWHLPSAFVELRQALEARHGRLAGARQYIRVLQLLEHHSVERVDDVLRQNDLDHPDADAIRTQVERLSADATISSVASRSAASITVPRPDLTRFNRLLPHATEGDDVDESRNPDAAQGELEAAQVADHVGRA
jgi:transposase